MADPDIESTQRSAALAALPVSNVPSGCGIVSLRIGSQANEAQPDRQYAHCDRACQARATERKERCGSGERGGIAPPARCRSSHSVEGLDHRGQCAALLTSCPWPGSKARRAVSS